MRWGFEGMLQVQFRGLKYPMTMGNYTLNIDGILVSQPLIASLLKTPCTCTENTFFCNNFSTCCLTGGRSHGNESVPSILVLPHPHSGLHRLHVALLPVSEVHQTEVQPGLVKIFWGPISQFDH